LIAVQHPNTVEQLRALFPKVPRFIQNCLNEIIYVLACTSEDKNDVNDEDSADNISIEIFAPNDDIPLPSLNEEKKPKWTNLHLMTGPAYQRKRRKWNNRQNKKLRKQ